MATIKKKYNRIYVIRDVFGDILFPGDLLMMAFSGGVFPVVYCIPGSTGKPRYTHITRFASNSASEHGRINFKSRTSFYRVSSVKVPPIVLPEEERVYYANISNLVKRTYSVYTESLRNYLAMHPDKPSKGSDVHMGDDRELLFVNPADEEEYNKQQEDTARIFIEEVQRQNALHSADVPGVGGSTVSISLSNSTWSSGQATYTVDSAMPIDTSVDWETDNSDEVEEEVDSDY